MHSQKGSRLIVMLAAPPGAGKSTLSGFLEHLATEVIPGIKVQAIGMDGFHRRQEYLTSHTTDVGGKKVLMVDIKGAPVTFDLGKLKDKLYTISITADPVMLKERLIERKISTGSSKEKAVAFVEFSGMANVMLCLKNTGQADLMLSLSKDTGYLTQEKSEER